jgi:hypothetical protein
MIVAEKTSRTDRIGEIKFCLNSPNIRVSPEINEFNTIKTTEAKFDEQKEGNIRK